MSDDRHQDEVRKENERQVFEPDISQDSPKVGGKQVAKLLQRGKRKHVGPHDTEGEEGHYRFHDRPMGERNNVGDKSDMDKLSGGIGEAEIAPVPCQYAEM